MTKARTQQSGKRQPQIGKDELNLADWPISVSTHQQVLKTTSSDGKKIDYIEYLIPRPKLGDQKVTLSAPSKIGLPTPVDEDVVIALLQLSRQQDDFDTPKISFKNSEIFDVLRWTKGGNKTDRLIESVRRLKAVQIEYELAWYKRDDPNLDDVVQMSGILSDAMIARRTSSELLSWIHFTHLFHQNLKSGNLTNLDLDLYFSLDRSTAKRLLRHLNKRFYGKRATEPYERDVQHLACGHLGMTNNKDLRRNLHRAIVELEEQEYITALPFKDRFYKVRPGQYRVPFELHPSRLPKSKQKQQGSEPSSDMARKLATAYHLERWGKRDAQPYPHEIKAASELLERHGDKLPFAVLSQVVNAVRDSFMKAGKETDQHFGASIAFFDRIIEERQQKDERRRQDEIRLAKERAEQDKLHAAKAESIKQRQATKRAFGKLTKAEQQQWLDRALAEITSDFIRQRIQKQGIEKPTMELLDFFEVHSRTQ